MHKIQKLYNFFGRPLFENPQSKGVGLLSVWDITVDRGQIPVWNYKLIVK